MATLATPRGTRRETPALAPVSGLLPAVMALGKRLEAGMIALFDTLEAHRETARTRRLLASLDDRQLADIGVNRGDIDHV